MSELRSERYWEQVAEERADDWRYTPPVVQDHLADKAADKYQQWLEGES